MFYSKNMKFSFIACPKTGSTSVESYLTKLDPDRGKFSITINDRIITGNDIQGRGGTWKSMANERG